MFRKNPEAKRDNKFLTLDFSFVLVADQNPFREKGLRRLQ